MKIQILILIFLCCLTNLYAQNSLVGDGFGGRLWYKSSNYSVGSYSGYTICGSDKQLFSWGSNNYHQLGNTNIDTIGSLIPIMCPNMKNVKFIASGYMTGVIKDDNTGWIWDSYNTSPIKVIDNAYFVDAGENYLAYVKLDGTVWCLGRNESGNFGNGNAFEGYTTTPSKMNLINTAVRVAVGDNATIVLTKSGDVYSVGSNSKLLLGIDSIPQFTFITSPIKINKLKNIIDIKATTESFIALDSGGNVWTWGEGALNYVQSKEPAILPILKDIVAISGCIDGHSYLAIDSSKNCFAWGYCPWGECSTDNALPNLPTLVATYVEDIMIGETFSYIIRSDGSIWASGQSLPGLIEPYGSIWLNLSNNYRKYFTKINPTYPDLGICKPINIIDTMILDDLLPPIETDKTLIMPNAFTPNNDNLNDFFKPINPSSLDFNNYKLKIYSRWGEELFSSRDLLKGWDGKYKGQSCAIGTYFYFITYETISHKTNQLKGECILLR